MKSKGRIPQVLTQNRKGVFLFFGYFIILSGTAQEKNIIDQAEWILGIWENKTSRGSIYESWKKASATRFEGKSYVVKQNDTVVLETIELVQNKEGLFYIPKVKNQNDGKGVKFSLKTLSEDRFTFENPKHDFPQRISYRKVGPDSLLAEISGKRNERNEKRKFPMRKVIR